MLGREGVLLSSLRWSFIAQRIISKGTSEKKDLGKKKTSREKETLLDGRKIFPGRLRGGALAPPGVVQRKGLGESSSSWEQRDVLVKVTRGGKGTVLYAEGSPLGTDRRAPPPGGQEGHGNQVRRKEHFSKEGREDAKGVSDLGKRHCGAEKQCLRGGKKKKMLESPKSKVAPRLSGVQTDHCHRGRQARTAHTTNRSGGGLLREKGSVRGEKKGNFLPFEGSWE